jgi:potassium-transporting ATPase potassium-binding subunit
VIYRLGRVDPASEQRWPVYAAGVLGFVFVSIILLYLFQRLQPLLPLDFGRGAVDPGIAFNTAISFVTNTNWLSYMPETVMGHSVQNSAPPSDPKHPAVSTWPSSRRSTEHTVT